MDGSGQGGDENHNYYHSTILHIVQIFYPQLALHCMS